MDITAILRQVDAEIESLQRVRGLVADLMAPASEQSPLGKNTRHSKAVTAVPAAEPAAEAAAELLTTTAAPTLTVLPPRKPRAYRRTHKPAPQEPRALSSAVPGKPVFIPRAATPVAVPAAIEKPAEFNAEAVEAALRQNLLGGVA